MGKNAYIGVNGVARKIKAIYVGVNGVAQKVKKAYIGVSAVAREWWSGAISFFLGVDGSKTYISTNNAQSFTQITTSAKAPFGYDATVNRWYTVDGYYLNGENPESGAVYTRVATSRSKPVIGGYQWYVTQSGSGTSRKFTLYAQNINTGTSIQIAQADYNAAYARCAVTTQGNGKFGVAFANKLYVVTMTGDTFTIDKTVNVQRYLGSGFIFWAGTEYIEIADYNGRTGCAYSLSTSEHGYSNPGIFSGGTSYSVTDCVMDKDYYYVCTENNSGSNVYVVYHKRSLSDPLGTPTQGTQIVNHAYRGDDSIDTFGNDYVSRYRSDGEYIYDVGSNGVYRCKNFSGTWTKLNSKVLTRIAYAMQRGTYEAL